MVKRKLEATDVRITGVQLSGDGENWEDAKDMSQLGGLAGGLSHIVDLITNGERVFVRTKYVDIYNNGTNGLPKTGATFELVLHEIQPMRRIIEGEKVDQKQLSEKNGVEKGGAT
jgi:hypothetical protein